MTRLIRYSSCHPDKIYYCKGLCQKCYNKKANDRRNEDINFRIKKAGATKAWVIKNPEKSYRNDRNKHLKKRYGITLDDYNKMWEQQKGLCFLCEKPEAIFNRRRTKVLAVDHNHKTGKIRSLLCMKCNTAIGQIDDNPIILMKLLNYLRGDINA